MPSPSTRVAFATRGGGKELVIIAVVPAPTTASSSSPSLLAGAGSGASPAGPWASTRCAVLTVDSAACVVPVPKHRSASYPSLECAYSEAGPFDARPEEYAALAGALLLDRLYFLVVARARAVAPLPGGGSVRVVEEARWVRWDLAAAPPLRMSAKDKSHRRQLLDSGLFDHGGWFFSDDADLAGSPFPLRVASVFQNPPPLGDPAPCDDDVTCVANAPALAAATPTTPAAAGAPSPPLDDRGVLGAQDYDWTAALRSRFVGWDARAACTTLLRGFAGGVTMRALAAVSVPAPPTPPPPAAVPAAFPPPAPVPSVQVSFVAPAATTAAATRSTPAAGVGNRMRSAGSVSDVSGAIRQPAVSSALDDLFGPAPAAAAAAAAAPPPVAPDAPAPPPAVTVTAPFRIAPLPLAALCRDTGDEPSSPLSGSAPSGAGAAAVTTVEVPVDLHVLMIGRQDRTNPGPRFFGRGLDGNRGAGNDHHYEVAAWYEEPASAAAAATATPQKTGGDVPPPGFFGGDGGSRSGKNSSSSSGIFGTGANAGGTVRWARHTLLRGTAPVRLLVSHGNAAQAGEAAMSFPPGATEDTPRYFQRIGARLGRLIGSDVAAMEPAAGSDVGAAPIPQPAIRCLNMLRGAPNQEAGLSVQFQEGVAASRAAFAATAAAASSGVLASAAAALPSDGAPNANAVAPPPPLVAVVGAEASLDITHLDWLGETKARGVADVVTDIWRVVIPFLVPGCAAMSDAIGTPTALANAVAAAGAFTVGSIAPPEQRGDSRTGGVSVTATQHRFLRVNCADSLDRTNLGCFFTCVQVLPAMVRALGATILAPAAVGGNTATGDGGLGSPALSPRRAAPNTLEANPGGLLHVRSVSPAPRSPRGVFGSSEATTGTWGSPSTSSGTLGGSAPTFTGSGSNGGGSGNGGSGAACGAGPWCPPPGLFSTLSEATASMPRPLLSALGELFVANGNAVAFNFTASEALHSSTIRQLVGMKGGSINALISAQRWYENSFEDKRRYRAIEMILGRRLGAHVSALRLSPFAVRPVPFPLWQHAVVVVGLPLNATPAGVAATLRAHWGRVAPRTSPGRDSGGLSAWPTAEQLAMTVHVVRLSEAQKRSGAAGVAMPLGSAHAAALGNHGANGFVMVGGGAGGAAPQDASDDDSDEETGAASPAGNGSLADLDDFLESIPAEVVTRAVVVFDPQLNGGCDAAGIMLRNNLVAPGAAAAAVGAGLPARASPAPAGEPGGGAAASFWTLEPYSHPIKRTDAERMQRRKEKALQKVAEAGQSIKNGFFKIVGRITK